MNIEQYNLLDTIGPTGPTGPTGATGPNGATGATGSTGASATLQNALFNVNATSISDGTLVPYVVNFINGADISALSSTTINLAVGHIYSVSYIFDATTENEGYVFITPRYNTTVQASVSTAATFFADTTLGAINLDFLYNGSIEATTPFGSVSIVELQ